ncbi:cysteine hydrolase family protein [Salinicoccus sp. HZC-1]|uniref:cysteine hydrolase family protein n=1 Tax=Salinicoccus sp. HZC-1 TaxID=3385497 RepID=UPI00398ADC91
MSEALLVIDYSYDFAAPDGRLTAGIPAREIEEELVQKIKSASDANKPVFFMMDLHQEGDPHHPESALFPPHNIAGTRGRELYGRVKRIYEEIKDLGHVFFIDKTRYSAFAGTNLDQLLRERNIDTVVLTGLVTDICILHTAVDAYNKGYKIKVPASCVASFNPEGHTFALEHFKNSLGATVER